MSAANAAMEHLLQPLDGLRVRALRATMPASSYFAPRRDARVALLGVLCISTSLLGTILAPLWMLALGPVLLGVPHLLADLRYCVVRPGWHRQRALLVGVGLPLLALALGAGTAIGFAAVAGMCAGLEAERPIPAWRRAIGVALAAAAALACVVWGSATTLVLLHLHNFVAVLLWWRWRARGPAFARLPLALFIGASLLIAAGALEGPGLAQLQALGASALGPLSLDHHLAALAPGLEGPAARRLVLLFTFAQSVHYVIWLRLIPEDDRERRTPRSFRASWRALVEELGPIVWLALALACALVGWALLDLAAARAGYLRLARFHAFLEFAVLASLWVSGRRYLVGPQRPAAP